MIHPTARQHPNAARKRGAAPHRGFTLIEMTIAIALTGIVSAGLMSALLFSTSAIPGEGDAALSAARFDAASEFFLADAMLASSVTGSTAEKLQLIVPDQTGDDAPDTVIYTFESGQLTRAINSRDARTLADNIASGAFSITTIDSRVSSITAMVKSNAGFIHIVSAECVARPEAN